MLILGVVICLWSGSAVPATAAPEAPAITQLAVHDTGSWGLGVFGPNGDLWVAGGAHHTKLDEINPRTGAVRARASFAAQQVSPLVLGPDGNVWFVGVEGEYGQMVVCTVDAAGHARSFPLPLGGVSARIEGFAAGPDEALWFTGEDNDVRVVLGRVTTSGKVETHRSSTLPLFQGPLVASNGYLWTTVPAPSGYDLAIGRISSSGRVKVEHVGFTVAGSDGSSLLTWDGRHGFTSVARFPATGRASSYNLAWETPSDPSISLVLGAVTYAADGRLWFTGGEEQIDEGAHPSAIGQNPVLGELASKGTVRTWPSPFVNDDDQGPAETLMPGPDGRLYSTGVKTYPYTLTRTEPVHIYAITLPDHPVMPPAAVAIRNARGAASKAEVGLGCTGQPGRYCSGYITLRSGGRVLASQRYALVPGTIATHTLATAKLARRTRVSVEVSTHDPIARTVKTVRQSFAAG